jgi:predicted transposase/invertase (TIGR01784 family)
VRFGDLKNDFVFRKIFGNHPRLTTALLNDILGLKGEERIEELTVLPPDQAPEVAGAKWSILDVRCQDKLGRWFVVEMQILHAAGFLNRVVYNGCKAYVSQLKKGAHFSTLTDVIAISICDFELWPDAKLEQAGLPKVPLISHWSMMEKTSKAEDLQQVRYTFVELPKVSLEGPWNSVGEQWAWLFRAGEFEGDIPTEATPEQQETLQLANEATWTQGEQEAYNRVFQEIDQARESLLEAESKGIQKGINLGRKEGIKEGIDLGRKEGLESGKLAMCKAIVMLCEVLQIPITSSQQELLETSSLEGLEQLLAHLKEHRAWPLSLLGRMPNG